MSRNNLKQATKVTHEKIAWNKSNNNLMDAPINLMFTSNFELILVIILDAFASIGIPGIHVIYSFLSIGLYIHSHPVKRGIQCTPLLRFGTPPIPKSGIISGSQNQNSRHLMNLLVDLLSTQKLNAHYYLLELFYIAYYYSKNFLTM